MSGKPAVRVEIDRTLDTAYIRLSDQPVVRTVEVTDDVMVDLDEMGVAVGIEVLTLQADLPVARLEREFHVHSEVAAVVHELRPTVQQFVIRFAAESSSSVSKADHRDHAPA